MPIPIFMPSERWDAKILNQDAAITARRSTDKTSVAINSPSKRGCARNKSSPRVMHGITFWALETFVALF
jgi:hypothetical protein